MFTTCFSSSFLSKPVLTNIHVNFFPMAFDSNLATTLLSTPPDSARITFEFPTLFLTSFINFFFWSLEDQFLVNLHIENIKFLSINFPLIVWLTSG